MSGPGAAPARGGDSGAAVDELLAERTALLDVLFGSALMGVAVFDRDLVLRTCNPTWARFVEHHGTVTAEEVVPGRSIFDYFPGTEPQILPAAVPVLAGRTRWHQAVPHARRDGGTSYWDLLFVPLCRDGEVVGVVDVSIDATERHLAESELRHSEARFQSILRNSSDVTVVIDADGTVRWAGPSVHRLLGFRPSAIVGRDVAVGVHRDDLQRARAEIEAAPPPPGEGAPFRCRLRHADGGWRTFEALAVDLLDDPDVGGIVVNARDITDRVEAEAELARRDAILEAVRFAAHRFLESTTSWRDSIGEVMARLGRAAAVSRVYIFENFAGPDGELRCGQSHEWVADGIPAEIDNPELQGFAYADIQFEEPARAMAAGQVIAAHVADMGDAREVLEAQGIVSIVLVPVFVAGQWWGFVGFDECTRRRDWSTIEVDALQAAASTLSAAVQRQRSEDLLREQQEEYRQVFEATEDGLVITDLDSRLVHANPAFYRMHGYRPGELTGRPARDWVHAQDHERHREFRVEIEEDAASKRGGTDVRRDGSTFPVQVAGSKFTFRGRPHVLAVVRDDTDRAQAFDLLETRVNALSSIAASLGVDRELGDTLRVIAESVVAATPALACSAYVLDPATGGMRVFSGVGLPDGYAEAVQRCWYNDVDTTTSRGFLAGELTVVRDATRQGLANPTIAPLHPILREAAWDTVAVVPLTSLQRSLGSVNAYYPPGVEPTPDDIAFLRAVADQGAVAVENSRLLVEAQARAGLEERQRLARELHDSVSQALYGIALGARTARTLAEHSPERLAEPLDYVLSLADAGMTEMRSLIFALRPESLAAEGLVAALEKQVAVLRSRHGMTVEARLGAEPEVELPVKEALYRIGQEALHNIVKHAHARRVEVGLRVAGGAVVLEVGDDGIGFDPGHVTPGHLGLQSMRERAAAHGGNVLIHSRVDGGTTVRVRLPAES